MKATRSAFLAVPAVLFAVGCGRLESDPGRTGRDVLCVAAVPSPETRTEYREGTWTHGELTPIDWVEGDRVRIYSPEAQTAGGDHFADYSLSPEQDRSRSLLSSRYGLQWKDESEHSFYGLYPAPETDNSSVILAGVYGHFTFTIPESQPDGSQMRYAAMTGAVHHLLMTSENPVVIPFYPAFSSYEVVLEGVGEDDVYLNGVALESETPATAPMSGTMSFSAREGLPDVGPFTETSGRAGMTFPGEGVPLREGSSVMALVIALPVDAGRVSLVITRTFEGTRATYSMPLKKDGEWVLFPAFGRHRITGVVSPEQTHLITVNSNTVAWNRLPDVNTDVLP